MMRRNFLVGVAVSVLLIQARCAAEPRALANKDIDFIEMMSRKLRADAIEYESTHPFKGEVAGNAIAKLQSEAFVCDIRFEDVAIQLKPVHLPYVFCAKSTAGAQLCKSRAVSLHVDWRSIVDEKDQLISQLKTQPVTGQYYYCEPSTLSPPKN